MVDGGGRDGDASLGESIGRAVEQSSSRAVEQSSSRAVEQSDSRSVGAGVGRAPCELGVLLVLSRSSPGTLFAAADDGLGHNQRRAGTAQRPWIWLAGRGSAACVVGRRKVVAVQCEETHLVVGSAASSAVWPGRNVAMSQCGPKSPSWLVARGPQRLGVLLQPCRPH